MGHHLNFWFFYHTYKIKGTISLISNESLCIDGNTTTVLEEKNIAIFKGLKCIILIIPLRFQHYKHGFLIYT